MSRTEAHRVRVTGEQGPWLILAHGIGGRPLDWASFVSAFAGSHRVLTFAQAGSVDADPELFSPARHCSAMGFADDLSMLCGELGVRDAVFVGHSIAGNAGVLAAVGDPGLFSKLVLINASPRYLDDPAGGYRGGFTAVEVERLLAGMRSDYDAWAAGFAPGAMANADRPDLVAGFIEALRQLEPQVAMTTFQAALTGDYREFYPRVSAPTLVLQSSEDVVAPAEVGRWIAEAIPDAMSVELSSTGHFPHLVDPDEVIRAITAFLRPSQRAARAARARR